MISFLADENFNARIVRGLRRCVDGVDVVSLDHAGLSQVNDSDVLERASETGRVVLTHDVNTMAGIALEGVRLGLPLSGLILVGRRVAIGQAIEDLALIATCAEPEDLRGQIWYLPL